MTYTMLCNIEPGHHFQDGLGVKFFKPLVSMDMWNLIAKLEFDRTVVIELSDDPTTMTVTYMNPADHVVDLDCKTQPT